MNLKKYWPIGAGAIVLAIVLAVLSWHGTAPLGSGGPFESEGYALFASSTLTSAYTGAGAVSSTVYLAEGLPNFLIGGWYLPKSYGSQVYIQIERSLDHGVTFVPYMTITPSASSTGVNTMSSPFIVPSVATAASGTAIGYSFDLTMVADYVRVSAKEVTTSTAGTLTAKIIVASN